MLETGPCSIPASWACEMPTPPKWRARTELTGFRRETRHPASRGAGSAHHRPGRYYHHNPQTAHRKLAAEKLSRPYQTVGPEAPVSHRSAAQDGQVA